RPGALCCPRHPRLKRVPMVLQSDCRFAVAPHFHLGADWPQRLLVGAGLEEVDDCFFPAHSWRAPTTDELPLLLRASDGPARSEELEACVSLFQLPGHLRSEWWQLLAQAAAVLGDEPLPGFDAFMDRVGEFLAFKRLPLPAYARCEVVVSDPGRRSASAGALRCNLAPWAPWPFAEEDAWPRLWGGINLGDEDTSVVLVNLSCQELEAELRRRFP